MSIFLEVICFNQLKCLKCQTQSISCVHLFVTPWATACQFPLSMELYREEYWSGLPFPSPGHLPNPGIKSGLLHCRQILYCLSYQRSPQTSKYQMKEEKKLPEVLEFPGGPMVGTQCIIAMSLGFIPNQGTKISSASHLGPPYSPHQIT